LSRPGFWGEKNLAQAHAAASGPSANATATTISNTRTKQGFWDVSITRSFILGSTGNLPCPAKLSNGSELIQFYGCSRRTGRR
jgi:hypothetical protein